MSNDRLLFPALPQNIWKVKPLMDSIFAGAKTGAEEGSKGSLA